MQGSESNKVCSLVVCGCYLEWCAHELSSAGWPGGGRQTSSMFGWRASLRRPREAERTIRPSPEGKGPPPSATLSLEILRYNFFFKKSHVSWQRRRVEAGSPSLAGQPLGGGLTAPPPANCGGPPGLCHAEAEPPLASCALCLGYFSSSDPYICWGGSKNN